MSTETTNKKIKIDNGTTFGRTYTDKAIDAKLPTDLIATANKLSLGVGNTALGNGVNLDGFTYDESTKTLKASGGGGSIPTLNIYSTADVGGDSLFEYPDLTNVEKGIYVVNLLANHTDPTIFASGFGYVDNSKLFGEKTLSLIISLPDSQIYSFVNGNKIVGGSPIVIPNTTGDKDIMIYDMDNNSFITLDQPEYNGFLYFDVNHLDTNNGYSWEEIAPSKTIPLFGKHSILVPKDSADTNIDLYIHNIVLKDTADTPTKKIYLTIQSTANAPATTKELLQTLLGSTARYIRVSGYTPTNDISAINWTGTFDTSKYDVRGTETVLTDFTVIEDSVVTLK